MDKRIGKLQRKVNCNFLILLHTSAPYIFISFPSQQSQQFLDQINMLAFKLSPLIKGERLHAHFEGLAHCSIWLNAWSKCSRAHISFSIWNKLIKWFTFPEHLLWTVHERVIFSLFSKPAYSMILRKYNSPLLKIRNSKYQGNVHVHLYQTVFTNLDKNLTCFPSYTLSNSHNFIVSFAYTIY